MIPQWGEVCCFFIQHFHLLDQKTGGKIPQMHIGGGTGEQNLSRHRQEDRIFTPDLFSICSGCSCWIFWYCCNREKVNTDLTLIKIVSRETSRISPEGHSRPDLNDFSVWNHTLTFVLLVQERDFHSPLGSATLRTLTVTLADVVTADEPWLARRSWSLMRTCLKYRQCYRRKWASAVRRPWKMRPANA